MSNSIRACFCLDHHVPAEQFYNLLIALHHLDCRYNAWKPGNLIVYFRDSDQTINVTEPELAPELNTIKLQQLAEQLATKGYAIVELAWRMGERLYNARLLQISHDDQTTQRITFEISEHVFLPPGRRAYTPEHDPTFEQFRLIMVELIKHIRPTIGNIDYEADMLCDPPRETGSVASWGNYFSQCLLDQWSHNDVESLLQTVSDYTRIEDNGILTFLQPLTDPHEAWTARHQAVAAILERNPLTCQQ